MTKIIPSLRNDKTLIALTKRRINTQKTIRKLISPLEHQEQETVIAWALLHERKYPGLDLLYAIPNGELRDKATAIKLQKGGVKPGVPDLCLPVPKYTRVQGGPLTLLHHGLYIEMKRRSGSQTSPAQRAWKEKLIKYGHHVVICKGADEAIEEIIKYLSQETAQIPENLDINK